MATETDKNIYGSDYETEPLTIMVVLSAERAYVSGCFYAPLGCLQYDENDWIDFLTAEVPDDFDPKTINRDDVMNSEHLWYEIYVAVPKMEHGMPYERGSFLARGQLR